LSVSLDRAVTVVPKHRIGVLASGRGSNFESLVTATRNGFIPDAEVGLLVCNRPAAGAVQRAERLGVECLVMEPLPFADEAVYFERIADEFQRRGVTLVCLAGFLLKVHAAMLRRFPGRILNIHPALLPKYGGRGMYGRRVHEAVLRAEEKETGCTVHLIDDEYDHGPTVLQAVVPVRPGDTPETLAARVSEKEHVLYPEAVKRVLLGLSGKSEGAGK